MIYRMLKLLRKLPYFGKLLSISYFYITSFFKKNRMEREWRTQYINSEFVQTSTVSPAPTLDKITSQLCTSLQFRESKYKFWCRQMLSPVQLARKQWEFVYTLEALSQFGMLSDNKHGLGFGCGNEPIPSVLANYGCNVVATDLDLNAANSKGWVDSNQHASNLNALNSRGVCSDAVFNAKVTHNFVDMNQIPTIYNDKFDFVWSCCALEHLGSIENGLNFIENSMKCLKVGGVAVHTTEFNLSSNEITLEDPNCVIFRKCDLEFLKAKLHAKGCLVSDFNFHTGNMPVDRYIDLPPYLNTPHLKLMLEGFVTTSIGLIIKKIK